MSARTFSLSRAKQIEVEGYLLQCQPLGERDEIITLFTKEMGKLKAKARGVRTPQSRMRGQLLQGHRAILNLAGKSNLPTITNARTIDTNLTDETKAPLWILWHWIRELVLKGMADEQPNPEIFILLETLGNFFKTQSTEDLHATKDIYMAGAWITKTWLDAIGLKLQIPTLENTKVFFDPSNGGFTLNEKEKNLTPLETNTVEALKILLDNKLHQLPQASKNLNPEAANKLHKILAELAADYTQRQWKTINAWPQVRI